MRALGRVLAATAALALSAALAAPASATGDDYPYRTAPTGVGDRWGFTARQCVSFVAWREAQARRPMSNAAQHWGSAYTWDNTARARGVGISSRPRVGAIAQWNQNERSAWYANGSRTANGWIQAGPSGHVAWVKAVYRDGSVLVEQYNQSGGRAYSTMRLKAPRYLYYGV